MNEYNSNFNGEDQDLRFIYQHDIAINGINGLLFAKLNSDPDKKNEVIVTREDNKLYVYRNDANSGSIELNYNQRFYCEGKIAATGKFTNDTLEDVAVISGSDVKIYKNLGNSNLDTVPVYTLHNVNADKVIIAQINSYIYPFSIINNTTGDRDEIIIKSDSIIKIYSNNNSNGISDSAFISLNSGHFTDFKIADIDNNGFNDLIVAGNYDGVKVFKNSAGTISSSASYTNTNYSYPSTLAVADFNKDGWNDIIMGNWHALYLFINIRGTYSQTVSYTKEYSLTSLYGRKLEAADLQNKGGISVLYSGTGAINQGEFDPGNYDQIESMIRFNASDTDAVPAPPVQFRSYFLKDGIYRPRIYMYNRGDRDFNKYRIYKRTPRLPDSLVYIGETTSNSFIDTTEYITENPAGTAPVTFNCIYFSTCTDHTSHESINSDTAKYLVGDDIVCMECIEGGDAMSSNTTTVFNQGDMKYNITNFPNPFNPATKIYYTIPLSGYVSIIVYNSLGQTVKELVNEFKNKGSHTADFNGSNLSSGIYFYKLRSGSFEVVRRMVLLK